MSPNELRDWLKKEQSTSAGWTNDSGDETIGHERYFEFQVVGSWDDIANKEVLAVERSCRS